MTPSKESMKEINQMLASFPADIVKSDLIEPLAEALDKYKAEIVRLSLLMHPEEMMKHVDCQKEISTLNAQIKEKDEKLRKAREALKQILKIKYEVDADKSVTIKNQDNMLTEILQIAKKGLGQIGEEE